MLYARTATLVSLFGAAVCISGANAALAEDLDLDAATPFLMINQVESSLDWVGICMSTQGSVKTIDTNEGATQNSHRTFSAPIFETKEDCVLFGEALPEHEISTKIELPVRPDRGVALLYSRSARTMSGVGMISLND